MPLQRFRKRSGYTLIEVLVAISIFILLLAVSLPFLGDFYRNQNAGAYCKKVRQAVYRAEYRARAGERDSAWGVHVEPDQYTLFSGSSYAGRQTQFDEVITLPSTMTYTGLSEVIFSKYAGEPNAIGTISILLNSNSMDCVTITSSGLVD